jgi:hypothetical protein
VQQTKERVPAPQVRFSDLTGYRQAVLILGLINIVVSIIALLGICPLGLMVTLLGANIAMLAYTYLLGRFKPV